MRSLIKSLSLSTLFLTMEFFIVLLMYCVQDVYKTDIQDIFIKKYNFS